MNNGRFSSLLGLSLTLVVGSACCAGAADPDKSAVTRPYPADAQGDLWFIGGQSNMCGFGTLKEPSEPDPRILFFVAKDDRWMPAREPLNSLFFPHGDPHGMVPDYTRLPVGGAGLGMSFAQRVLKYTGRPLGIIGVATGGPAAKTWSPDFKEKPVPGDTYPRRYIYQPLVKRIIQAGGWGRLKGVVWYQGESDAVELPSAAKVYENSLGKFIDRLRIDTGNPDLPFIIVQIDRQVSTLAPGQPGKSKLGEEMADALATYTEAWEHVRDVQRQMADNRKNVYVVSAIDLGDMVDPIHLEYESFRKLGLRIAEVALSQVYKLPGHATPIKLKSVRVEPLHVWHSDKIIQGRVVIRVRFSGVNGRLRSADRPTGFQLRFEKAKTGWAPYQTEFDPQDPQAVLLRYCGPLPDQLRPVLYYGSGLNPYCNIVDEKDVALPAFGPVAIPPLAPAGSPGKEACLGNVKLIVVAEGAR
jgi:sialate O-acetylesterase